MIIAFPLKPTKMGGPGSFQRRFEKVLRKKGWQISYLEDGVTPDIVMVLGNTKRLGWLLKMKLKGVPIIFRLGGINWLYRIKPAPFIKKLCLRIKLLMVPSVLRFFADGIIYQSEFCKEWLLKLHQSVCHKKNIIIYNGVDLEEFVPQSVMGKGAKKLLCLEGNIDYSPYAIELLNQLQESLIENSDYGSLVVYGNFEDKTGKGKLLPKIKYMGVADREELPSIYRDAVYLSLDLNPACPNTVIEALASGIPVIGFDSGALKEITEGAGARVVSYGSDPWQAGFPDADALTGAAVEVLNDWENYSASARKIAERKFSVDNMYHKYISFISEIIG